MPRAFRNGFTLIELLIVVSLIGILATIVYLIINPSAASERTRDSQRITALKTIQTALDLYQTENRRFPTTTSGGTPINAPVEVASLGAILAPFVDSLPVDPKLGHTNTTDAGCSYSGGSIEKRNNFYYMQKNNGEGYYLYSVLENSAGSQPCTPTVLGEKCYCTQN
jgi:prepilin-type N-terminal cleavage/methylation domain-containing protein